MDLLIIGYSSVFKNRILPLINRMSFIDSISIAKYEGQSWDNDYKVIVKPVKVYDNYKSALNEFKSGLAYVSTTNHSHYEWAKKCLNKGLHTIIDKPATESIDETLELIQIAKQKNLLLSESTVYLYHPQMILLNRILKSEKTSPKLITIQFSFPPLDKDNFRYHKELGGGALMDTGPYAASIGRFLFNDSPLKCYYIENSLSEDGVEISYSILLKFKNGGSLIGHFGFTTEYINRLNILTDKICVDMDRVFTLPETYENIIRIKKNNQNIEISTPSGSMFEYYFLFIEKCLKEVDYEKLYSDLLLDAQTRDSLNKCKENGN